MPLSFNNLLVPGIVRKGTAVEPPDRRTVRSVFPGVHGEVEVLLGSAGRMIVTTMTLFHPSWRSYTSVRDFLIALDARKNEPTVAKLVIGLQTGATEEFENTTFVDYRRMSDILPDVARTLNPGGYFVDAELIWRQLSQKSKNKSKRK